MLISCQMLTGVICYQQRANTIYRWKKIHFGWENVRHMCGDFVFLKANFVIMSQTSQELRMLSSVTLNCQETKTVMNSDSQLSE